MLLNIRIHQYLFDGGTLVLERANDFNENGNVRVQHGTIGATCK